MPDAQGRSCDALFATLDTWVAKLWLPSANVEILASDTIGFIQDLPPQLVDAFRSTLEETVEADLLCMSSMRLIRSAMRRSRRLRKYLRTWVSRTPRSSILQPMDWAKACPRRPCLGGFKMRTPVFVSAKTGRG